MNSTEIEDLDAAWERRKNAEFAVLDALRRHTPRSVLLAAYDTRAAARVAYLNAADRFIKEGVHDGPPPSSVSNPFTLSLTSRQMLIVGHLIEDFCDNVKLIPGKSQEDIDGLSALAKYCFNQVSRVHPNT